MWDWAVEGTLDQYERFGVRFIPQPNGQMHQSISVWVDSPYDHDAVTKLNETLRSNPKLREAVFARVREMYGLAA